MAKVFVFAPTQAVSKAGKPYSFQPIQVIQGPHFPDAFDRLFVNQGAEPLTPGLYEADMYVRSTPTGNKPAFHNFVKAD